MYLHLGEFTPKLTKIKSTKLILVLYFLKNTKLQMPECVWAHWHMVSSNTEFFWEGAPHLFLCCCYFTCFHEHKWGFLVFRLHFHPEKKEIGGREKSQVLLSWHFQFFNLWLSKLLPPEAWKEFLQAFVEWWIWQQVLWVPARRSSTMPNHNNNNIIV